MNCACWSSDQTEGSGMLAPNPAASKGERAEPLALRDGVDEVGGVGIADVSPTKSESPGRLGRDASGGSNSSTHS